MVREVVDAADWRARAEHVPLQPRTNDPEAVAFDQAVSVFRNGLGRARRNEIDQAAPLVACAYLMDARSLLFLPTLPDDDREQAGLAYLDAELLQKLLKYQHKDSFAPQVLRIYAALLFAEAEDGEGKNRITEALSASSELLTQLSADPKLSKRAYGSFRKSTIHKLRSALYLSMGDAGKAADELTCALYRNPNLASVRYLRACLWAGQDNPDPKLLFGELDCVVGDSHPDARHLREVYARMAKLALLDHGLATFQEACLFRLKSNIAAVRCDELYGEAPKSTAEQEMEQAFARAGSQGVKDQDQDRAVSDVDVMHEQDDATCAVCGVREDSDEAVTLMQCSLCQGVSYCSKMCQIKDWAEHRLVCESLCNDKRTGAPKDLVQRVAPQIDDRQPSKNIGEAKSIDGIERTQSCCERADTGDVLDDTDEAWVVTEPVDKDLSISPFAKETPPPAHRSAVSVRAADAQKLQGDSDNKGPLDLLDETWVMTERVDDFSTNSHSLENNKSVDHGSEVLRASEESLGKHVDQKRGCRTEKGLQVIAAAASEELDPILCARSEDSPIIVANESITGLKSNDTFETKDQAPLSQNNTKSKEVLEGEVKQVVDTPRESSTKTEVSGVKQPKTQAEPVPRAESGHGQSSFVKKMRPEEVASDAADDKIDRVSDNENTDPALAEVKELLCEIKAKILSHSDTAKIVVEEAKEIYAEIVKSFSRESLMPPDASSVPPKLGMPLPQPTSIPTSPRPEDSDVYDSPPESPTSLFDFFKPASVAKGPAFEPREPIPEYTAQELANQRMRASLQSKWTNRGDRFCHWWHNLRMDGKIGVLDAVTGKTIPEFPLSKAGIASMLDKGDPRFAAHVLTDFCLANVIKRCDCESGTHLFCDQLIHDMRYYIMSWDHAERVEYRICYSMVEEGVFPSSDGFFSLGPRFLQPPGSETGLKVHKLLERQDPVYMAAMEQIKRTGKPPLTLKEKDPFNYLLKRDMYRLGIYYLIFEQFDHLKLKMAYSIPLARIRGCEHCRRSCEAETAVQCEVCCAKYWCSPGCQSASIHGKKCPIGTECSVVILFNC